MKVSLSWLKEFLETNASVQEISEKLSSLGLVVDGVDSPAEALQGFIVGEILTADPHPDADKLQVCQVSTGSKTLQVVCGAKNARPGLKVALAQPGMTMPVGGLKLRETAIRGVDSFGMLCSASELGLEGMALEGVSPEGEGRSAEPSFDGILEIDPGVPVGSKLADIFGLDDPVFDIDVTPNRGDCFGIQGIARDLAAAGLGTLRVLPSDKVPGSFPCPFQIDLNFEASKKEACPYFSGRMIRGVKNGPSPLWLQKRLTSVGLRPISALVDITNYMAFAFARPLHVFDADKIAGDTLMLRPARAEENFLALDEKVYPLQDGMTVICDGIQGVPQGRVISLAGIIGGDSTACDAGTTSVFLESAYFSSESTARTGQALGIISDARMRFERGVDPSFVRPGLEIATQLILDLCGGEVSDIVEAGEAPKNCFSLSLSLEKMRDYTGVEPTLSEASSFLKNLGCEVQTTKGKVLNLATPSWRHDLQHENDLFEELLRLKGYDAIPQLALPPVTPEALFEGKPGAKVRQNRLWIARRSLASLGFSEVMTWSFISQEEAALFGGGDSSLILENPISQDMNTMRPSLLPGLLKAVGRNQDRGQDNPRLFEMGACYKGVSPEDQEMQAVGVRAGQKGPRHWRESSEDVSLYDIKQDVVTVLAACGVDATKLQVTEGTAETYHPGRSGRLCLGPKVCLAEFGEIHPKVLKKLEVKGPVVAFEIFLGALPLPKVGALKKPVKISNFQPVERDLAFIVEESVTAQSIIQAVKKAEKELITTVEIFDHYRGVGVPEGKKSVGLTFRLEPHKETLTDEKIHHIMNQVIDLVEKKTGGALRS